MFFPIGLDEDEVRRTPNVSYAIIAVNVVVFGVQMAVPGRLLAWGFVPAEASLLHMWTATFLHAGFAHLLGNMVFFYVTGPFIEDAWGRVLFALFYTSAGIVAALLDMSHDPEGVVPRVGASGAIAGVMGAFLIRFGRRRIRFIWWSPPFTPLRGREIRIPAWLYMPFWFGTSLLIASTVGNDMGTAEWAHVGGFIYGMFVALLVWGSGFERRFMDVPVEGVSPQSEILVKAMEAGRSGRLVEARRQTAEVLLAEPGNVDARRLAFDLATRYGDPIEIAKTDGPLLERYIALGEKDMALDLVSEVRREWMAAASSRFLLKAGDFLAGERDPYGALEMYERVVDSYPKDPAALKALLKITDLRHKTGDLPGAWKALERANQHPGFSAEWLSAFGERRAKLTPVRS
jgi:membrane associated rhomboid family serine protease